MVGTHLARLIVERLSVTTFQRLLDGVMVISGLAALLWAAVDSIHRRICIRSYRHA